MIREISLENFKAFGSLQKIPLKPITLIYGANSSGKSSILNALLLLKQTYEQSIDPNTPILYKGQFTDQQNFSRCINGRDTNKKFSIGIGQGPLTWSESILVTFDKALAALEGRDYEYKRPQRQNWEVKREEGAFGSKGKIRLFVADTDDYKQKNTYSQINGNDILKTIEYFINDSMFCSLEWIGNKVIREDGSNILFENEKISALDDPLVMEYKDKIPDEYLEKGYSGGLKDTSLKMQMDFDFDAGLITEEVYECHPYAFNSNYISEEIINKLYEYIINSIEEKDFDYKYDDFKNDLIYNLKRTIIFVKNGIPFYFGLLDGGDSNRKLYKSNYKEFTHIYNFFIDTIIDQYSTRKSLIKNLSYIGPLRKHPERFTDIVKDSYADVGNEGERTTAILYKNPKVLDNVNNALKSLGMGYQLKVHQLSGDDMIALGDIYSLQVIDKNQTPLTLCDIGFGISQILPILVQSIMPSPKTVLIEQPEIHLHPKMQTELGDFFIEQSKEKQFIIETHSEHLLLRILRRIREGKISNDDVNVLFVKSLDEGSQVIELRIDEDGDFIDEWPGGFFEESFNEKFARS